MNLCEYMTDTILSQQNARSGTVALYRDNCSALEFKNSK